MMTLERAVEVLIRESPRIAACIVIGAAFGAGIAFWSTVILRKILE